MQSEYTHYEMFKSLEQYLISEFPIIIKYMIEEYRNPVGDIRVPLYCRKKERDKVVLEIAIDIITSKSINKDELFPLLEFESPDEPIKVYYASPVLFYQYYLPKAKIYLAFPDYIEKNSEYDNIVSLCKKYGIGMLEVAVKNIVPVKQVLAPITLAEMFLNEIEANIKESKPASEVINKYLENNIIRLIYYGDPVFKRRAIIDRMPWQISFVLIDKLKDLQNVNVVYKRELNKLYDDYRTENRDDYEIALYYITKLWQKRLAMRYPQIHMHMEDILQKGDKYREHFVHQFQVFLIGIYILDQLYDNDEISNIRDEFNKDNSCLLEDAWLAASTFHDFNYGLQDFDSWLLNYFKETLLIKNEVTKQSINILNLDSAMVRELLINKIIDLVKIIDSNNDNDAIMYFYEKFVRDKNHGVLSALSLLKLWEKYKSKKKLDENAIRQVSFAIACHDEDIWEALSGCKGYVEHDIERCEEKDRCKREIWSKRKKAEISRYNELTNRKRDKCELWEQLFMDKIAIPKIEFKDYPLLFLLIYCDSIQDEGRIIFSKYHNDVNRNGNNNEVEIEITDKMIFEYWVEKGTSLRYNKNKKKIKEIFSGTRIKLTDEARAYNNIKSYAIWKIIDKNAIYIIENPKGKKYIVKKYRKESRLTDIEVNADTKEVKVSIAVDGIYEKINELGRISWALKDQNFKITLNEDQTEIYEKITINGIGGWKANA